MKIRYTFFFLCLSFLGTAQVKILFDATKTEMAGNADWVIDADLHTIFTSSGPALLGGSESNPQRYPTPAQSGVTSTTAESFWQGALSYMAIDCVKQGYTVETLPYNGTITYGNSSNLQDLSNYKVFVVDEPNISFTAAEKTAILTFVNNGGGLLMLADHTISDRNNDGVDSPVIWNDLMATNTVMTNPFGIVFDQVDITQTTTNVAVLPTNTVLHGSFGNVTKAQWSGGTTMTLNPTANSSVKGLIYKTGSSSTGTTNVMVAMAQFGSGKVVAIGDSSIADDGTGDTVDTLYDGYIADANGNHRVLLMNAIVWLATQFFDAPSFEAAQLQLTVAPNPVDSQELTVYFHNAFGTAGTLEVFDALGRLMTTTALTTAIQKVDCAAWNSGFYWAKVTSEGATKTTSFVKK